MFLAGYYYNNGDSVKAGDYYQKILEVNPYSIEAKEGLAKINHIKASEIQSSEIVAEPADISGLLASADAYMKYGLIEKAVAELQSAISMDSIIKLRTRD